MSSINRVFGLSGSGLDIDKIVLDLMQVQRMKQDSIKQNKTIAQWQESDYRDLNNSLRTLRDNAFTMKLQGTYQTKQVTSSNEGIVRATAGGAAVTGSNTMQVKQLASNARLNSSEKVTFDGTKTTLAEQLSLGSTGTVTFKVNGSQEITIDTNVDNIDTLVSKINAAKMADGTSAGVSASFDKTLQHMFISSTATGLTAQVKFDNITDTTNGLFEALKLGTPSGTPPTLAAYGTNAVIKYNGIDLEQSSNQFTIAGVSYTLTGTSDTETVNINLTNDTDAVYNSIKSFVELYNTTIEKAHKKLSEERNTGYLPLTDDQREKLSETQQTQWEAKAKSGLLRNDSILSGVIYKMRSTLSSSVSGIDANYNGLADIGITTGAYYESGKLYINDQKLKDAITTNPQAVMELFTKTSDVTGEKGLAVRIYDNLTDGINQIIDKAGSDNSFSLVDNSALGKRITLYNQQIADWDTKLKSIEDRYYKQFTALETALSKMNQQSLQLASLFGTGN